MESDLFWSEGKIGFQERCRILRQRAIVVWFTGLSGSGKSTLAIEVESRLADLNFASYRLDGDNIRLGLNSDLGFSEADRYENIRRIAEVAALFKDAGIITLVSFITPLKKMRELAKLKIGESNFFEIYVKAGVETCATRDPKGLYAKAINDGINNFTGISSVYEEPENPILTIDTERFSIIECVDMIIKLIIDNSQIILS